MSRKFPRFSTFPSFAVGDAGWLVAALLPLIGILPTLSPGVIDTADGPLHVQRIFAMGTMLGEGVLYPRWVPWFHLGFGYPIFNFYAPGVFYLSGLLMQFGLAATTAFTLVAALAWIVGSMGVYGLARQFLPVSGALLAAALWAYAPSRLFEVWDQGSLPQMMAAALFPWIALGVIRVAAQPTRRGILAIALPLAGLIFSHQPITFISALYIGPLTVLATLWAARHDPRSWPRRFAFVIGGVLLGAGLAMIFLLPLVLELRYVQAARGAEDNVAYLISNFLRPHEIFAQPQPADLTDLRFELPTTFGLIGGVLAVPGLIALAWRRRWGLLLALVIGLGFTLFMLLEVSLDAWLTIPYFRQLRFPERFLRVGATLLALAGGASVLLLPRRWQWAGFAVATVAVIVAALPLVYPNKDFIDWDNLSARDEIDFELANATWGTTSYDEFDPIWGRNIPLPSGGAPDRDEYVANPLRLVVNRVDMARYGDIMQVTELDAATTRVTLTEPHSVRFHQYYFPGWTATVNGEPAEIYPDDEFGLITLDVPPGEHVIRLHYAGTTAQRIGTTITLASLALVLVLAFTPQASTQTGPLLEKRLALRPAVAISAAVIGFALVNTLVIAPETRWFRHESPVESPAYMATPVNISFGGTFELLGYTIPSHETAPGDFLDVMLFWRAERTIDREYRPVVQLVNLTVSEAWAVSEPFFPGGGHTPGYPQDQFASEVHELRLFESAEPYMGRLLVQMVDAATGEPLLLPDGSDRLLLDPLIRVRGSDPAVPDRLGVRFGDAIALHCAAAARDGGAIALDVRWHVLATPAHNLTTFVHGLDGAGQIIAQADREPLGGNYPTIYWQPGQHLADSYTLPADDAITQVALGLYAPVDGTRSAVTQNGERLPDDRLIVPIAPTAPIDGDTCDS